MKLMVAASVKAGNITPVEAQEILKEIQVTPEVQNQAPRVELSVTVNLLNYESMRLQVESTDIETCKKLVLDALRSFKAEPNTRERIEAFAHRLFGDYPV
jgi:hypothetical protein